MIRNVGRIWYGSGETDDVHAGCGFVFIWQRSPWQPVSVGSQVGLKYGAMFDDVIDALELFDL